MAKTVRDAMTVEPRSAEPGLSLAEAARLMKNEDVGSLPVVDDGRLVAMLTDRDIVVRAVAEGVDANTTLVGDVASREPVTIGPEQPLDEALALMARHQVRRLPVVDQERSSGRDRRAGRRCPAGDGEAGGRGAGGDFETDRDRIVSRMRYAAWSSRRRPDQIRSRNLPRSRSPSRLRNPSRPSPRPEPPEERRR
jgi:CBS domain-containing protein